MRLFEIEENIVDLIKRECKPYLEENPSHLDYPLYRGIKVEIPEYKILPVNKQRKPVDMPTNMNNYFDKAFKNNGFEATRSNSIYCTGDSEVATRYGSRYVVYPIGNFSFTWSESIRDLFGSRNYVFNSMELDDLLNWKEELENSSEKEYILKSINSLRELKDFTLDTNINELSDVQIQLLKDDLIYYNRPNFDMDIKYSQKPFDEFVRKDYQNDNLSNAINSGNEIMITCDNYIAINNEYFNIAIRDNF